MPSSYRIKVAILLALFLCLGTIERVAAWDSQGEAALMALKFSPVDQQLRITLEGNNPLEYNVIRPEARLILVDLPGTDTAKLQPNYSVNHAMVELVRVRQITTPAGKKLARLEIVLRQEVQDRTRIEGNNLIIDLQPSTTVPAAASEPKPAVEQKSATLVSRVTTRSENGQVIAIIEADGLLNNYKTFSLHNPERAVIDIANVRSPIAGKVIDVSSDKLQRIRVGASDNKNIRIVFDTKEQCNIQVEANPTGLTVYFVKSGKTNATKAVKEENNNFAAPPVAPPDAGLAAGAGSSTKVEKENKDSKENKENKENKAKAEEPTKAEPKSENAESRASATVPSVKGPSARPGMVRGAVAKPTPAAPTTENETPAEPQDSKMRFGDPGFVGDPISIDIAAVDINDILRFISDNYGENFILDKSVGGVNVTVKVNDVPWNQVLESIFRANQLSYVREGSIVRIATLTALAVEQEQQRRIDEEKVNNLPKISKFFRLRFTRLSGGGPQLAPGSTAALGGTNAGQGGATGLLGIVRKNLSKVGEVDSDPRTNQIIVTDIPQRIAAIEEIIAKLDVPEPQVEIEARVVIANRNFLRSIGNQLFAATTQNKTFVNAAGARVNRQGLGVSIDTAGTQLNGPIRTDINGNTTDNRFFLPGATAATQGTTFAGAGATAIGLTTGIIGTTIISSALTLSESKGVAKQIAAPRITVQNNTPADITSGTQIAVQTEVNNTVTTNFVTAALRLTVTPQVIDEGSVLLKIVVENNSVDRTLRTLGGVPAITTQRAETLVVVPDGGTTILGGVNLDGESSDITRTPGLSNVPFLGELFKKRGVSRNSSELLFFVTPRIYRPETLGIQAAPAVPAPTQPVVSVPQTGGER
ncbi:MAG: type IV pilus secretin PilQ [Acidobacteriota bacterium]